MKLIEIICQGKKDEQSSRTIKVLVQRLYRFEYGKVLYRTFRGGSKFDYAKMGIDLP